jgi:hypothetical protein
MMFGCTYDNNFTFASAAALGRPPKFYDVLKAAHNTVRSLRDDLAAAFIQRYNWTQFNRIASGASPLTLELREPPPCKPDAGWFVFSDLGLTALQQKTSKRIKPAVAATSGSKAASGNKKGVGGNGLVVAARHKCSQAGRRIGRLRPRRRGGVRPVYGPKNSFTDGLHVSNPSIFFDLLRRPLPAHHLT